jgi:hypothetical protein
MLMGMTPPAFPAIDRTVFESMADDYLTSFVDLMFDWLVYRSHNPELRFHPDLFVLTGGNSQWYFVKDMLTGKLTDFGTMQLGKIYGDEDRVLRMARPQETVSLGLVYSKMQTKSNNQQPFFEDDLYNPNRQGFAVYLDGWVFFSDNESNIYRMQPDGSQRNKFSNYRSHELYAAEGWLYCNILGGPSGNGIYRIHPNSGRFEFLFEQFIGYQMRVVNNTLYFFNGKIFKEKDLFAMDLKTKKVTKIIESKFSLWNMAVSSQGLFFLVKEKFLGKPSLIGMKQRENSLYEVDNFLHTKPNSFSLYKDELFLNKPDISGIKLEVLDTNGKYKRTIEPSDQICSEVEWFEVFDGYLYYSVGREIDTNRRVYDLHRMNFKTCLDECILKGMSRSEVIVIGQWVYFYRNNDQMVIRMDGTCEKKLD